MRCHAAGSTCLAARVAANSSLRSSVVASLAIAPLPARQPAAARALPVARLVAAITSGWSTTSPGFAEEVVSPVPLDDRPQHLRSAPTSDRPRCGGGPRGVGDLIEAARHERRQQLMLGRRTGGRRSPHRRRQPPRPPASAHRGLRRRTLCRRCAEDRSRLASASSAAHSQLESGPRAAPGPRRTCRNGHSARVPDASRTAPDRRASIRT